MHIEFPKVVKDFFVEDDGESTLKVEPPKPVASEPHWTAPTSAEQHSVPVSAATMEVDDTTSVEKLMDVLKKNTDFNTTPVGLKLTAQLESIKDLGLTEAQQIKVAMKTGQITAESIFSSLQNILTVDLEGQKNKADNAFASGMSAGVESKKKSIQTLSDDISNLEKQIADKKAQQVTLSTEMVTADAKLQRFKINFQAAYENRKAELQKQIEHYNNILGGTK